MTLVFDHRSLPQRILFGAGKAAEHLAAEVARRGASRVMVIAENRDENREVASGIEVARWYHEVVMHVPVEVAERARAVAADEGIDLLVSIGGGSATGLAKAVALTTGLPFVAVPTTYAGSEATNVWGLTEDARKRTGVDDRVLPGTIVYDSHLMLTLPTELAVSSGLNALAHCVDALWAPRADPINAATALEAVRALSSGLPRIVADPTDIDGRDEVLYGAYLAAVAFASAGSGIHHKICHVLGGTFDLPHAQTHATVLPYVVAFNAAAAPAASRRLADALGADTAVDGLADLWRRLQAPRALQDFGFQAGHVDEAVAIALPAIPADNPRPVTTENLRALIEAARIGADPAILLERE